MTGKSMITLWWFLFFITWIPWWSSLPLPYVLALLQCWITPYLTCLPYIFKSMSISITLLTDSPHPYILITLFNILLSWYSVQLGICLTVKDFSYFAEMIRNEVPFTNITSCMKEKIHILWKYIGILTYSYISILYGLCLTALPLTPARSAPKIDFSLVISFTVIVTLWMSSFISISLYSCSKGWPSTTCSSWASLDISNSYCVYPLIIFLAVCTSITSDSVFLRFTYGIPSPYSWFNSMMFTSGM